MWSEKNLKILKEFRTLDVKDITAEHVELMLEYSKAFEGKLSSRDTQKMIALALYLLKKDT